MENCCETFSYQVVASWYITTIMSQFVLKNIVGQIKGANFNALIVSETKDTCSK